MAKVDRALIDEVVNEIGSEERSGRDWASERAIDFSDVIDTCQVLIAQAAKRDRGIKSMVGYAFQLGYESRARQELDG